MCSGYCEMFGCEYDVARVGRDKHGEKWVSLFVKQGKEHPK